MTQIRLAGCVHDSIVDGPGLRFTVFTQGCLLACPGCHNATTQPLDQGTWMSVDEVIADMASNPLVTGLTLSGGEPSLQPRAAAELAEAAHQLGLDVWCYTGYRVEPLLRRCVDEADLARLLDAVDVLVDGRFVLAKRTLTLPWRGSSNQRLIDMPSTRRTGSAVMWQG